MISRGCVLNLPMQEGVGAVVYDRSRYRNHGAFGAGAQAPTWVQDPTTRLWTLSFDGAAGADDIITVTDATGIRNIFASGGSLGAWIKPSSDGEGSAARIYDKFRHALVVNNESAGAVKLRFYQGFSTQTGDWTTTNTVVALRVWSFVMVVYSSAAVTNDPTIYVNSVSVAVTETATPIGTATSDVGSNLIIGNEVGTIKTFDGLIGLLRIFNRVLSPTEIANAFQQDRYKFGI